VDSSDDGKCMEKLIMKTKKFLSIILSFAITSTTVVVIPFKSKASPKSAFVASYSGTFA